MVILPQVIVTLIAFCVTFGLASFSLFRRHRPESMAPFGRIVPHPRHPGSMISFATLPSFLMLITILHTGLGIIVPVELPINGPGSYHRMFDHPRDVNIDFEKVDGTYRLVNPRNTAALTANAVRRVESGSRRQRIRAIHDLAWWTSVCPNYSSFTMPRLTIALRDPDPSVRGAAAIALGSTGGHGQSAIPDLLAARGTSVKYFNYLVLEARFYIEHSPKWPPEEICEDVSIEELEQRAAEATGPDEVRDGKRRGLR